MESAQNILYFNIKKGSFAAFEYIQNTQPQAISLNMEWEPAPPFGREAILIPTLKWIFKDYKHFMSFLKDKMNRDGHYVIAHRAEEDISAIPQYNYIFPCFGIAYFNDNFFERLHDWTDVNKSVSEPKWLLELKNGNT